MWLSIQNRAARVDGANARLPAFYATTKLSWGLRKEVHGFVQENKAVMRVCGLEGSGINIWKEK